MRMNFVFNVAKWKHEKAYFDNVVSCNNSWIYHYDLKTKQQSMRWVKKGCAPTKKMRAQKSQLKIMVITFWDRRGTTYEHYCKPGQTANTAYYEKVITQLTCAHILRKQPEYRGGKWKLHRDNARHISYFWSGPHRNLKMTIAMKF